MSDPNDIARAEWVIKNRDSADLATEADGTPALSTRYNDKNNDPSKLVMFTKAVDGVVHVVLAAGETKNKTLWLESAFMQKNTAPKGAVQGGQDPNAVSDPRITPKAGPVYSPSDTNISQSLNNNNTQDLRVLFLTP